MSDALAAWKAAALADVELPSGTKATIGLPDLVDCMVAGDVPLAVVQRMQQLQEEKAKALAENPEADLPSIASQMSAEEMTQWRRLRHEAVRLAVKKVEGEPVSLSLEDVADIPPEDRDQIARWAMREEVLPGKAE